MSGNKTVLIETRGDDIKISMWFLGTNWLLETSGFLRNWMVFRPGDRVKAPLKHLYDTEYGLQRQMTAGDDSPLAAVTQAKIQLLRLKYKKATPTFHEQHSSYFGPS